MESIHDAPIFFAAKHYSIFNHCSAYVNAPYIAKERGIEIKETKSRDAGDFLSLVVVRVTSPKKTLSVMGTLLSKREPRIVRIDNFTVEIVPEGHMLFMYNNDKPGVIGGIASVYFERQYDKRYQDYCEYDNGIRLEGKDFMLAFGKK
jgi:hypothetical protein